MSDFDTTCQQLQSIFNQFCSTQSPSEELLQEINNIPKQPQLILPILSILENQPNTKIGKLCATQINNLLRNEKNYDDSQLGEIFQKIFIILPNIQEDITRIILLDYLLKKSVENEEILNQLIQLSFHYLENQPTVKAAIHIWGLIMPIPKAYEPNIEFIYSNLFPIAINALHAEDQSTRLEAYEFFAYGFTTCVENDEQGRFITPEFCQTVTDEIVTCIQPLVESIQSENEITAFCRNLSTIIESSHDYAQDYLIQTIFEPLMSYIAEESVPCQLKLPMLLPIVSMLVDFGIEFAESLPTFIPIVINLSVELARENPEEGVYEKTNSFFENATLSLEDAELTDENGTPLTAITVYMPHIEELIGLQEPAGYLTIFLIFTSILAANPATVIELYDDIEGMIEASLAEENELLIDAALNFLLSLVNEAPTTAVHIQSKFEPILIQLISSLENITLGNLALYVLYRIYQESETEPENSLESLQFLMSMFESDNQIRHEYTFNALSALIQHMQTIPEDVYPTVKPIIEQLISSGEGAIGSAIEGYGAFATVNPYIIAEDLGSIIDVLHSALQQQDIDLIDAALTTSLNIFEPFCETLSEQIPAFFEASFAIAKRVSSVDEEEDAEQGEAEGLDVEEGNEEADRLSQLQEKKEFICGEALTLSTLLFRLVPTALADHAQELQETIQQFLFLDKPSTIITATKASPDFIIGFTQIGQNPAEFFKSILENFASSSDEDTLSEFWNALSFCYHALPNDLSLELAEPTMEIVIKILAGQHSIYNRGSKNGTLLKPDLVQPILVMVEEVLIQTGENFAPFIDQTVQGITRLLEDKNPVDRCLALVTLSMIASYFPDQEELIQIIAERLSTEASQTYQGVKFSVFLAYHFLTLANKAIVQEIAPQLLNMAIEAIKDSDSSNQNSLNAAVLWGTLVEQFELSPSQEDLEAIFTAIPAQAHNYLLKANAIFVYYGLNRWPELIAPHALPTAVTVLGSDDITQRWIPTPVAIALAQIIANAEEGAAEEIACHNQLQISNYRRHIEQLQHEA